MPRAAFPPATSRERQTPADCGGASLGMAARPIIAAAYFRYQFARRCLRLTCAAHAAAHARGHLRAPACGATPCPSHAGAAGAQRRDSCLLLEGTCDAAKRPRALSICSTPRKLFRKNALRFLNRWLRKLGLHTWYARGMRARSGGISLRNLRSGARWNTSSIT